MKKIAIIGAGPAGIMAALNIKTNENEVILIDKNKVAGQKLSITGSGRCNITNIDSKEDFFAKIPENSKFFYSAFSNFSNYDLITYLEENGIKLKYEGNRVYPQNESAQKTVNTFIKLLEEKNIKLRLNEELTDFEIDKNSRKVVSITTAKCKENIDYLVIASGGMSYCNNKTFDILMKKGINITKLYPSLVGIETLKDYSFLSGISIRDVEIKANIDKKIFKTKGDIIFTQKGISGPAILNMSSYIVKYQDNYDISKYYKSSLKQEQFNNKNQSIKYKGQNVEIFADFIPSLSEEELHNIIFGYVKKQIKSKLGMYLPERLLKFLFDKYEKTDINNLKKEEKIKIIDTVKKHKIIIKDFSSIKGAIVTKGGVALGQISPSTMKFKDLDNLYFAGECLDIDAMTGGYNLQIAFSTAYLAAKSIKGAIAE